MASLALSIGLTSRLKRREELIVPSWPAESIRTGIASGLCVVTPRILPIKQVLSKLAPATLAPIQITLVAVVTPEPAELPKAVLRSPLVLLNSAPSPIAVVLLPVVAPGSELVPMAVLALPVVILWSA